VVARPLGGRGGNGRVDAERIRAGIAAAGLDLPSDVIEGLVAETVEHARQVHGEGLALARLADAPLLELPRLIDGVDLGSLYELAESLRTRASGSWRPPDERACERIIDTAPARSADRARGMEVCGACGAGRGG
jgi:hypothetical protein